ncbi:serine protease family S33 [Thraustotheca clavata]|uniref:Serine protease family S33 n=1 Tax=Thraustotheca clavata TaxID=74557 RepID=A0A1W0A0T2_9STRA|nr:serine protease family S33 [Thraustotheca clavata]
MIIPEHTKRRYELFLYLLNYLHYSATAKRPTLIKQDTPLTAQLLRSCTLLLEKYHPTWFLFSNGHLQTLMVIVSNSGPLVLYKRQELVLEDGGTVSLDWAIPSSITGKGNDDSTLNDESIPTVLLLHGLSGGSHEEYMMQTAEKLVRRGYRVVVMNARGCANTPVTTPKLFCPAYTQDVREVVAYLRAQHMHSTTPFLAVGFSLGANILTKYVGEEGEHCTLLAAVSVGNPYDFVATNIHITHSWFRRHVYNAAMTQNLLKLVFHLSDAHEQLKDHPDIDLNLLEQASTLTEYDEIYSRHVFGYETPMDIYRDASSTAYIKDIAIPMLCVSSDDDPICTNTAIPYNECRENPNVMLAVTHTGGHLGFFTGNDPLSAPDRWCVDVIEQYCTSVLQLSDQEGHLSSQSKKQLSLPRCLQTQQQEDKKEVAKVLHEENQSPFSIFSVEGLSFVMLGVGAYALWKRKLG